MRTVLAAALVVCVGPLGCATLFRESNANVRIESDPPGARAEVAKTDVETPSAVRVPRSGFTEVKVSAPGFAEHRGSVRKHLNGWWVFLDVSTCIVPVLLCVPLIADGIRGAWTDIDTTYRAHLQPDGSLARAAAVPTVQAPPPPASSSAAVAESSMSDSERLAAARAAYEEGVELQSQGKYLLAIERLQVAQRLVDAPTNLLHLAESYEKAGKLVEAYETYETLAHKELPASAPAVFREAIATGKKEMLDVKPRIASLRIDVHPSPASFTSLTIAVNGRAMPLELVGIPRPMNPGAYKITATAHGLVASAPIELTLREGETRTVDIKLRR